MNKILDFSPPVEIEIPGPLWLSFPEFSPQEKTNLFAVLEAKHSLLSKAIPGFSIEKDGILISEISVFGRRTICLLFIFGKTVPDDRQPQMGSTKKKKARAGI